ncbi:alpha/beta fold hydrolase [Vibrio nomapromontoriensis]|uniref:alpha/beta fold hydrolase n=1 Tax=Vibrio nomapromontoriensis TaxID=2910246 RepID=UPI003D0F6F48
MRAFKECLLQVNDRNIAYLEYQGAVFQTEETTVKTVVFVHGWMDNAASFHKLLTIIEQQRLSWRVLVLDLPGHGHSTHKNSDHFYSFHDYIDDLHQVLVNLQAVNAFLVGHSLGALIASCYSAAFPENVAGLVQIEAHFPMAEDPVQAVSRLRKGIESRERWRNKKRRALPSFDDAVTMRMRATKLDVDSVRPIVERDLQSVDGQWYWRHDSKLKCESVYRMSRLHAEAVMSAISIPHMVILGRSGYGFLQDKLALEKLNNVQVEWVDGDHHCHLESPDRVFELISELVNKN